MIWDHFFWGVTLLSPLALSRPIEVENGLDHAIGKQTETSLEETQFS